MHAILTLVLIGAAWAAFSIFLIWIPAWLLWNAFVSPIFDLPTLTLLESTGCLIFLWVAKHGAAKFEVTLGNRD
jgi:hypothetical protein